MDNFTPMRTQREPEQLEARLQHVEDTLTRLPEVIASQVQMQTEAFTQAMAELRREISDLKAANADEPA